MRWSAVGALTLIGCSSGSRLPEETNDVIPIDDTFPDAPSPPPSNRIDAAWFTMQGIAAYDSDEEEFVGTVEGNGLPAQPVGILFTIWDSSGARACQVLLSPAAGTAPPAEWTEGTSAVVGFELLPGETEVIDGCVDAQLPLEFNGDAGSAIAKWTWGLGIGEIDEDLASELEAGMSASEWDALKPLLAGATLYSDFLLVTLQSAIFERATARGYALDKEGAIFVGGTGELTNVPVEDLIVSDDELGRAYYEIDSRIDPSIGGLALVQEVPGPNGTGDTGGSTP